MSLRTLSVRNKIEDGKMIPEYVQTDEMIADWNQATGFSQI